MRNQRMHGLTIWSVAWGTVCGVLLLLVRFVASGRGQRIVWDVVILIRKHICQRAGYHAKIAEQLNYIRQRIGVVPTSTVHDDDAALVCGAANVFYYVLGCFLDLPATGINIPKGRLITNRRNVQPRGLVAAPIGKPKVAHWNVLSHGPVDDCLGVGDLLCCRYWGDLGEQRMEKTVVSNLVSINDDLADNFRVEIGVSAQHKKCRFDLLFAQCVQNADHALLARFTVKGDAHIGPIPVSILDFVAGQVLNGLCRVFRRYNRNISYLCRVFLPDRWSDRAFGWHHRRRRRLGRGSVGCQILDRKKRSFVAGSQIDRMPWRGSLALFWGVLLRVAGVYQNVPHEREGCEYSNDWQPAVWNCMYALDRSLV